MKYFYIMELKMINWDKIKLIVLDIDTLGNGNVEEIRDLIIRKKGELQDGI